MKKLIRGFANASRGIVTAVREQRHMRIHICVGVIVIAAGLYFQLSAVEWCIIATMISLVIATELINTAIEGLTDLVSPGQNPLAGKVKDIAAGAVLVAVIAAIVVGVIIFAPHLNFKL